MNPHIIDSSTMRAPTWMALLVGLWACDPVPAPPEVPEVETSEELGEGEGESTGLAANNSGDFSNLLDTSGLIQTEPFEDNELLWTINSLPIHTQTYHLLRDGLRMQIEAQVPPEQLIQTLSNLDEEARNQLIAMVLLEQAAMADGIQDQPEVVDTLASSLNEILAQRFVEDQLASSVDPAVVEAWYNSHLVQFLSAEHPDGVKPLEEVRSEIEAEIQGDAMRELMSQVEKESQLVPGDQPELIADADRDGVLSPTEKTALDAGSFEPLPQAPEGKMVAVWINGRAYTEDYFLAIIGPQMRRAQMAYQQQLQSYLTTLPQDQQEAAYQQAIAQLQQQMAREQQMIMQTIISQTLLADRAKQMGYAKDRDVLLKHQLLRTELLASFYFDRYAQSLIAQGQSPGPALMQDLVQVLWAEAEITDPEGTPIAPPETHAL
jgi:hypothetical protein